jgi:hypothetical protein
LSQRGKSLNDLFFGVIVDRGWIGIRHRHSFSLYPC